MIEAADLSDVMQAMFWVGMIKVVDERGSHFEAVVDVGRVV